jgi:hypothetical protein
MVPTPGCWARDDMGALFAGVFWGVLVTAELDLGTFMVVVMCGGVVRVRLKKRVLRGRKNLRSGGGIHLLISDGLRHLGDQ